MNYAIELLQRELNKEQENRSEALLVILEKKIKYSKCTIQAFEVSEKLASERIPQLQEALNKLKA